MAGSDLCNTSDLLNTINVLSNCAVMCASADVLSTYTCPQGGQKRVEQIGPEGMAEMGSHGGQK